jgi:hypothetical protein
LVISTSIKHNGEAALKLSGQMADHESYSGVAQGISVSGKKQVQAKCATLDRPEDGLKGTENHVTFKIEFYDRFGAKYDSSALLGAKEDVVVDASSPAGQWQEHELLADVPSHAVEARVAVVFTQPTKESGSVYVDNVEFNAP